MLPTFFTIALVFGPIGGLLLWGSSLVRVPARREHRRTHHLEQVSSITIEYTGCSQAGPNLSNVPHSTYDLRAADAKLPHAPPQWASTQVNGQQGCRLRFELPANLQKPVFLYYKLTSFYQNHRRYVRSIDSDQLQGKHRSKSDIDNSDCKPLTSVGDKVIYPCGLVANSIFNGARGELGMGAADMRC